MKVRVLFEKETVDDRYQGGWGLCYLIGEDFLFDSGEKFEYLEHNARAMGIDLGAVKHVFISHDHWDHTGGLWKVLEKVSSCTVYACRKSEEEFVQKLANAAAQSVLIEEKARLTGIFYSTGQLIADYKGMDLAEQGLVCEGKDGLVLFSGCAHPGIMKMVESVKKEFSRSVSTVIGGLHMLNKEKRYIEYVAGQLKKAGVQSLGAAHCTGFDAQEILRREFGKDFIDIKTGMAFDI